MVKKFGFPLPKGVVRRKLSGIGEIIDAWGTVVDAYNLLPDEWIVRRNKVNPPGQHWEVVHITDDALYVVIKCATKTDADDIAITLTMEARGVAVLVALGLVDKRSLKKENGVYFNK